MSLINWCIRVLHNKYILIVGLDDLIAQQHNYWVIEAEKNKRTTYTQRKQITSTVHCIK